MPQALKLFGARSRASYAVESLTDASAQKLRLARQTGQTVLRDYEDVPKQIDETDQGLIVRGQTHALLLTADGDAIVKALPPVEEVKADEAVLTEDTGDIALYVNPSNLVKAFKGESLTPQVFGGLGSYLRAAVDVVGSKALDIVYAEARRRIKKDKRLMADLAALGREMKEHTNDSQDPDPMKTKTRLTEDDYAEIVVGDDGLLLLVNGEMVAAENCDLSDEAACRDAEAALTRQAQALGYVDEGTFDASHERGGPVVNGDEQDDHTKGEGYYARRYRRRTSDASTGKPTMPAIESWLGWSDAEKRAYLAEQGIEGDGVDFIMPMLNQAARDHDVYAALAEAFPFKKKKAKDDEEEEDDEEEDEDDDEDFEEDLIGVVIDFLGEHASLAEHAQLVREFDQFVSQGHYEPALEQAEVLAAQAGKLDEYRRLTGSRLSRFRRSMRTQTAQEKARNRQRRRAYRSNPSLRRKAAKYRVRTRRFRRRSESVGESEQLSFELDESATNDTYKNSVAGKASANDTFRQAASGVFADLKGAHISFGGLKERVAKATGEAVNDPQLMRVVSEFVQRGLIAYEAGKGYALPEVAEDSLGKLAKAARTAGNKYVVTLVGGQPLFFPTNEDAIAFWKTLHPKMRGLKTTISSYMEHLGMAEDDEDES